jgi:hypothetical protein
VARAGPFASGQAEAFSGGQPVTLSPKLQPAGQGSDAQPDHRPLWIGCYQPRSVKARVTNSIWLFAGDLPRELSFSLSQPVSCESPALR